MLNAMSNACACQHRVLDKQQGWSRKKQESWF